MSDNQTFVQSIWSQKCLVCINNYIVVGLGSKLLMSLSYYIYLGFGKKLLATRGSNRGPSDCEPSTLPLDQNRNFEFLSLVNLVSFLNDFI